MPPIGILGRSPRDTRPPRCRLQPAPGLVCWLLSGGVTRCCHFGTTREEALYQGAKSMPVRIHIGAIDDERALGTHEVHQMRGRDVEHFVRPQCRPSAENRKPKTLAASSSNNSWRRSKSGKPSSSPVTRRFAISLCAT